MQRSILVVDWPSCCEEFIEGLITDKKEFNKRAQGSSIQLNIFFLTQIDYVMAVVLIYLNY